MNEFAMIQRCVDELAAHNRNTETMLYRWKEDDWFFAACNPSIHCPLGEVAGEYFAEGQTALEAIEKVLKEITA